MVLQQLHQMFLLMQLTRILQRLIVAQETTHAHVARSVGINNLDIEIAHHVVGEVIASQLEEQLIVVDGIRIVGNDIEELLVTLGRELTCSDRIAVAEHHRTAAPNVTKVELASM